MVLSVAELTFERGVSFVCKYFKEGNVFGKELRHFSSDNPVPVRSRFCSESNEVVVSEQRSISGLARSDRSSK